MTGERKELADIFITPFFSTFQIVQTYLAGRPEGRARPRQDNESRRRRVPSEETRSNFEDVSLIKRQIRPNRNI